jgi:tRNA G46 methylase TrmB
MIGTASQADTPSSTVRSAQHTVHPQLEKVVRTHLRHAWRAPLHPPSVAAFEALQPMIAGESGALVLDSGCGTGESTLRAAAVHPDCLVVGVDKSAARLGRRADRFPHREGNAVWLRAELATFWRLAVQAGWRLQRHYLLYPNPWPKPGQLRRRWHAHPVFPDLLRLGGRLELRSNWAVYAEEFAAAVNLALDTDIHPNAVGESAIVSPFERKYRASGHRLYSVSVSCEAGAV